jgi:hypothetical protein
MTPLAIRLAFATKLFAIHPFPIRATGAHLLTALPLLELSFAVQFCDVFKRARFKLPLRDRSDFAILDDVDIATRV